jgi:hypothetical protein
MQSLSNAYQLIFVSDMFSINRFISDWEAKLLHASSISNTESPDARVSRIRSADGEFSGLLMVWRVVMSGLKMQNVVKSRIELSALIRADLLTILRYACYVFVV